MITKHFLETYPLLKKLSVTYEKIYFGQYGGGGGTSITNLPRPPINLHCRICTNLQTFNMENGFEHFSTKNPHRELPLGKIFEMRYLCASCNQFRYIFYIEFGIDRKPNEDSQTFTGWVRKIGQSPPWEINIDDNLEKALGQESELYKKGLVCESQSYGIGSYAYFRRITENIIDELLDSITSLIDEKDRAQYVKAIQAVKTTKVTEKKIELVQDLLPNSLQPNGINPLKSLHSALSDGIHNKSDDQCLDLADTIKTVLTYLLEEIRIRNDKAKNFTDKMKKLLGNTNL